jgi:hypothetical protein
VIHRRRYWWRVEEGVGAGGAGRQGDMMGWSADEENKGGAVGYSAGAGRASHTTPLPMLVKLVVRLVMY